MRDLEVTFTELATSPQDIMALADAARAEGFRFVDRLVAEFRSGDNTFSAAGEALFGAFGAGLLVGIGGLNVDPYSVPPGSVGRVRRLYVRPEYRGEGVGAALLDLIERRAWQTFTQLNLFTDSHEAAGFYEARGYTPTSGEHLSHFKRLGADLELS